MTVSEQESAVAVEQARLATNKHYELPPEVFAAFLDKRLKAAELGCRVTGVTPAPAQAAYIDQAAKEYGVSDLVDIVVGGFSDAPVTGRFDAATAATRSRMGT